MPSRGPSPTGRRSREVEIVRAAYGAALLFAAGDA